MPPLARTPEGLELLRRSAAIASLVMEDLAASLRPGISELEAAETVPALFQRHGGEQVVPPLVLFGPRTATAMDEPRGDVCLREGDLVMLDLVGGIRGVGADFTRMFTWGEPGPLLAAAYEKLKSIQEATIAAIAPGKSIGRVAQTCLDRLWQAFHVPYAYDRIGHGVDGLDGRHLKVGPSSTCIFEAGMAVTIEPGFYDLERGIGMRLESDVVIELDGTVHLVPEPPRGLRDLSTLADEGG